MSDLDYLGERYKTGPPELTDAIRRKELLGWILRTGILHHCKPGGCEACVCTQCDMLRMVRKEVMGVLPDSYECDCYVCKFVNSEMRVVLE